MLASEYAKLTFWKLSQLNLLSDALPKLKKKVRISDASSCNLYCSILLGKSICTNNFTNL